MSKKKKYVKIPKRRFNPHKLKKAELLWMWDHRCRHGKRYFCHPNCYMEECVFGMMEPKYFEKTGFLDIESTGLKANWDFVICYCIEEDKWKDGKPVEKIHEALIMPKEIKNYKFDKRVMENLVRDIRRFDRIIVHWGRDRRHDIPFLRSRAIKWGLDFPLYKEIYVTDTYDIAKAKLSLHRYRLETICQFLGIPAKGHRLEPDIWLRAKAGCRKSLKFILEHCREDVRSLRGVWEELHKYTRNSKRSI